LGNSNQLFVNGSMVDIACWPNNIGSSLLQPTLATAESGTVNTIVDTNIPTADWNGATVWCLAGADWVTGKSTVTGFDTSTHTISFTNMGNSVSYYPKAGNKYCIRDTLVALDIQNEWYYDGTTVYLWKTGGGTPSGATVEVKKRNYGFDLSSRSYINVTGINIFAAGIDTNSTSSNCSISGMTASYVMHGQEPGLTNANQVGGIRLNGTELTVKNSTIQYSSNLVVAIKGNNNKLINNNIFMGNYSGVWDALVQVTGSGNLISNNTISEAGRACVYIGGSNNQIQYNDIYNAGRLTTDIGIMYQQNVDGGNTHIHHNKIHDNLSTGGGGAQGIYLDNYTENFVIDHNVVWGCDISVLFNIPSENNLVYNNTLIANGSSFQHSGTIYPNDMYGDRLFNNIFGKYISTIGGSVFGNNVMLGTDPVYVNETNHDYHLQSTSPAINTGTMLAGITDGYVGQAPDIGAYEYNGTDWTAGCDLAANPNPSFNNTTAPYINLASNAGFETGSLAPWTSMGGTNTIVNESSWGNTNAAARTNLYGVKLGGGTAGIQQTITGLTPNTTYVASVWMKVAAGETVEMGVSNYGGTQISSQTTDTAWNQKTAEFTTGSTNTSATIFISKTSTGMGYAWGDCITLTTKDSDTNSESFENGFLNWVALPFTNTATASTAQAYNLTKSYKVNADADVIEKRLNASHNKTVRLWFYDDATDSTMVDLARVDDGNRCHGIGVNTATSTSNYSIKIDSTWSVTTVSRATGWHELKWDYITNSGLVMYIDGTQVRTSTTVKAFNYIAMGDFWADGKTGAVYFDNLIIDDEAVDIP
jgi:hypothetical protein